jgi:hypothetical protein
MSLEVKSITWGHCYSVGLNRTISDFFASPCSLLHAYLWISSSSLTEERSNLQCTELTDQRAWDWVFLIHLWSSVRQFRVNTLFSIHPLAGNWAFDIARILYRQFLNSIIVHDIFVDQASMALSVHQSTRNLPVLIFWVIRLDKSSSKQKVEVLVGNSIVCVGKFRYECDYRCLFTVFFNKLLLKIADNDCLCLFFCHMVSRGKERHRREFCCTLGATTLLNTTVVANSRGKTDILVSGERP